MQIHIKRVYEPPASSDGLRVLVDRLWPRGVTKEEAAVDVWAKELAPSNELRKWFAHKGKFTEFTRRYRRELASASAQVEKLMAAAGCGNVTLLYAARNTKSNHALVLQTWLQRLCETRGAAKC